MSRKAPMARHVTGNQYGTDAGRAETRWDPPLDEPQGKCGPDAIGIIWVMCAVNIEYVFKRSGITSHLM